MQYILSEEEYNAGCELVEAFREENLELGEVLDKSENLNKQGFFYCKCSTTWQ